MGSRAPSERDRFWLKHHEAQQASGETAKAYAASAGIAVRDLYQGRKRLRERGLLAPGRLKAATPPRFSKVAVTGPASAPIEEPRFRITLPNGAVLEWSGAASVGPVADLVERMARLP